MKIAIAIASNTKFLLFKNDEDLSRKISRITKADLKNGGDGAFYIFLKKIK